MQAPKREPSKIWVATVHDSSLNAINQREEHGVDLSFSLGPMDLNFQTSTKSIKEAVIGENLNVLTGSNIVPIGPKRNGTKASPVSLGPCSKCLSNKHQSVDYHGHYRCALCFRWGHLASYCCFPPRFTGLSKNTTFSNQINLMVGTKW